MVGWERLELSANGLKGHCSTTELPTHADSVVLKSGGATGTRTLNPLLAKQVL